MGSGQFVVFCHNHGLELGRVMYLYSERINKNNKAISNKKNRYRVSKKNKTASGGNRLTNRNLNSNLEPPSSNEIGKKCIDEFD